MLLHKPKKILSREKIENVVLPGFEGVHLGNALKFVIKGFTKGVLVTRASSIAFYIGFELNLSIMDAHNEQLKEAEAAASESITGIPVMSR